MNSILSEIKSQYPNYKILKCFDNGDFYSFEVMPNNETEEHWNNVVGGIHNLGYKKKTKEIFQIDMIDIIEGLLNKGKEIDFNTNTITYERKKI